MEAQPITTNIDEMNKIGQELFGKGFLMSHKTIDPPVIVEKNGETLTLVHQDIPAAPITPPAPPKSPKKSQFTYKQSKRLSEILEQTLGVKFWINLTKEDQENEKEENTSTEFYRLGFCTYNNIGLVNIMRFWPDKTKAVKGKSFATLNLQTMRHTNNSQHPIHLSYEHKAEIVTLLNIDYSPPMASLLV